jgi:hypothetical protein
MRRRRPAYQNPAREHLAGTGAHCRCGKGGNIHQPLWPEDRSPAPETSARREAASRNHLRETKFSPSCKSS